MAVLRHMKSETNIAKGERGNIPPRGEGLETGQELGPYEERASAEVVSRDRKL
jgi:hypothetical protein